MGRRATILRIIWGLLWGGLGCMGNTILYAQTKVFATYDNSFSGSVTDPSHSGDADLNTFALLKARPPVLIIGAQSGEVRVRFSSNVAVDDYIYVALSEPGGPKLLNPPLGWYFGGCFNRSSWWSVGRCA